MSEPARDYDARANAQEELDAILREAMGMRNSGQAAVGPLDADGAPRRATPVLAGPGVDGEPVADTLPSDGVKFDRYKIKVPEAGPNKLPVYRIHSHMPLVAVLGVIALGLWVFVPGGIQLLRAQPIPNSFADASARWTLALTRQRIDRFQELQGRLPSSLEELDPNLSEVMTYQGLPGGGYELRAPGHRQMFTLKSDMSQERFLARSANQLKQGTGAGR